jgi:hypothetical protein
LAAGKPVLDPQAVVGKRRPVVKAPEFVIELLVLVVTAFQDAVFNPKRVQVVVVQVVPGDFDVPSVEVFSVEKRNPFLGKKGVKTDA